MKKIILEFTCENSDDEAEAKKAMMASNAWGAISALRGRLFRPARKHGYGYGDIQGAFDACEAAREGLGAELVGTLENEFGEILKEWNIDEED